MNAKRNKDSDPSEASKPPSPPETSSEVEKSLNDSLEDWTGEPPETAPDEPSKDLTEVAKQYIAGKWGKGQEARIALHNAGYDPNEVQTEVVRILNR